MKRSQFQAWAEAIRGHWLGAAVLATVISLIVSGSWHHLVPTTDSRRLEALNEAANRKPVFKTFLNDKAVTDGDKVKVPTMSGSAVLEFSVQNTGTAPTADFEACITYPAVFTNVLPLGWQRLPAPASFDHDRVLPQSEYAHYSVESKSPMAQGLGVSLPPITITQPRPMVLSFMVWSGTSEKVRTTLNLTFDAEPSTMTTTSP
jgi:hypothetical protein